MATQPNDAQRQAQGDAPALDAYSQAVTAAAGQGQAVEIGFLREGKRRRVTAVLDQWAV